MGDDTEFQSVEPLSKKRPWAHIRLANNCSCVALSEIHSLGYVVSSFK